MPQLNKGGKFVFGKSLVREDGSLRLRLPMLDRPVIAPGDKLMCIRSSERYRLYSGAPRAAV